MVSDKRVVVISTEFPPGPGGIGTHAYELARHLHRRQWQVHVITPQDFVAKPERDRFNERLCFQITPLPAGTRRRLVRIWHVIRRCRPQLLLATGRRALWATAMFSTVFNIPWLAVAHGTEFLNPSPLFQFLTNQAVRRARHVVAVSEYTAQLMDQKWLLSINVIPNGANGERFRPNLPTQKLRQQLGLMDKRVLLTVGHVSERKAQDVVIRALPQVLATCPDVVYLIVGLPTRQKELAQLAQACGVAEKVRFAGVVSVEMLPTYYNLCDLFVLVSRQAQDGDVEGYGIVVIEAALCGKTAVVSDHGGLPEAVHQGETGLVVPAESPEKTAEAIVALLTDEGRREMLAQRALHYATEATWDKRIAAYDAILRSMINN